MKKATAVILALILALSLTACGGKGGDESVVDPVDSNEPVDAVDPADPSDDPAGSGDGGAAISDNVSTYADVYRNYEAIIAAIDTTYTPIIEAHNLAIEEANESYWNDPQYYGGIIMFFVNIPIAFTATIGDDGYEAGITGAMAMFDRTEVVFENLSANDYRITYKGTYTDMETWTSTENVPWEVLCGFDPSTGSLYYRDYATVDGERMLTSYMDFVAMGGGRYAIQDRTSKVIVDMDGSGAVAAFDFAAFDTPITDDSGSVFPGASGVNADWVTAGEDMEVHITLTADSMHIMTPAVHDDLSDKPEKDITIAR